MDDTLYEKLLNAAFQFVSYRPRSEKEIRDFLHKKHKTWKTVGEFSVEKVIIRLRDYGYIDDAKFAAWWVEQRSSFRPKGRRLISMELSGHGVEKDVIEAALTAKNGNLEPYNELEGARKAVARKLAAWEKLPVLERKKKVFSFLGSRGFSGGIIGQIIDEISANV